MRQTVFLIGARASGKTTLGRALAKALGYEFVDTDQRLEATLGRSIAEVVEQEGWEGFRQHEAATLRQVSAPGAVVATGGGMILRAENRQFMRASGVVVYLYAPAEVLAARLAKSPDLGQRPTLTGRPVAQEVAAVLAEREPLYRATANYILDATTPLPVALTEACRLVTGGLTGQGSAVERK